MRALAWLALTVWVSCGTACAAGSTKPVSPALIDELMVAMELEKSAEQSADVMLKALEQQMPSIANQILGPVPPNSLKADERQRELAEFQARFNKRYKELLAERVQLGKTTREIYAPLFERHYTEDEVKGLIAFYKSPLGKKVLKVMPSMTAEALAKSNEVVNPKIMDVVQEIIAEERARAATQKVEGR
jgi:uncharacterized protein